MEEDYRAVQINLPPKRAIDIEFCDITCTVSNGRRKGKKQIIKGVSGKFKSGELTAIMGPSGAGKTTLLNILTGFQTTGMEGTITSTGRVQNRQGTSTYKKESCYILQDDHLAPLFTVEEIMMIASDLKLGYSISQKAKNFLIDNILDTLGLDMTRQTRCQSLSGGQKKRLSIALELIDNPPIMFLDEPTTGLDSLTSLQCIEMLKRLAHDGRTIICTIHQPSASIYEMFDHVYVMAEGRCIYQGASLNTVNYLASVGFNCPQYHNPADFLLEVANKEYGDYTDVLAAAVSQKRWRDVINELKDEFVERTDTVEKSIDNCDKTTVLVQSPSEWWKFCILVNRAFLQLYRDWTISHLRLALHFVVGIFLGLTYFKCGNDGSKGLQNSGLTLISIVYLAYTSLMPAALKFPLEVAVLKKERFNNWYKLKTYFAAFIVTDLPFQIAFALAYSCTLYFLSSQPQDIARFIMFTSVLTLVTMTASSMGFVIGTLANPVNGTFIGAIITAYMLLESGYLAIFSHMPWVMYILSYLSYLSYANEGLFQSLYGFNRASLPCPDEIDYCHFKEPYRILEEFGMEKANFWYDIIFLLGNIIVLKIINFCTLKRQLSPKS